MTYISDHGTEVTGEATDGTVRRVRLLLQNPATAAAELRITREPGGATPLKWYARVTGRGLRGRWIIGAENLAEIVAALVACFEQRALGHPFGRRRQLGHDGKLRAPSPGAWEIQSFETRMDAGDWSASAVLLYPTDSAGSPSRSAVALAENGNRLAMELSRPHDLQLARLELLLGEGYRRTHWLDLTAPHRTGYELLMAMALGCVHERIDQRLGQWFGRG